MDDGLRSRIAAAVGHWHPGATVVELSRLQGGRSGETYRADLAGAGDHLSLAVKVAPAGLAPNGNRDVLRQARMLAALEQLGSVRVPQVVLCEQGDPPEVPPMFAMNFVDGQCLEPHIDAVESLPEAADLDRRARHAARLLAALHGVKPAAVSPAGEPNIAVVDELERWERLYATVPPDLAEGASDVLAALRDTVPEPVPGAVVHGDYRLGNTLCRGGEVLAVIDWEIWAIGDPRVDLAWFLLTAQPELHPNAVRVAPGMPSADDLVAEYVDAGGTAVDDLAWFTGLVLYKMAAIVASIVKRNERKGDAVALSAQMRGDLARAIDGASRVLGR